jgi:hypothetical protein
MTVTSKTEDRTKTEDRRTEPKRIQFEFSADAVERMNRMREQTDASSYAELVRNALRVYEWFIQQEKGGYDIGLVKDETLVKTIKLFL